jgi:NAD(P) transhydrogenase subunit alpha
MNLPLVALLTIFMLACFVGYYVIWKVTPALHTPLMSVTNAISSIIILGGILAAGKSSSIWGYIAIFRATINIFGGFVVTQRMLVMYKKEN